MILVLRPHATGVREPIQVELVVTWPNVGLGDARGGKRRGESHEIVVRRIRRHGNARRVRLSYNGPAAAVVARNFAGHPIERRDQTGAPSTGKTADDQGGTRIS